MSNKFSLESLRQAQGQYEAEQKQKKQAKSGGNTDKYIKAAGVAQKMMSSGEGGGDQGGGNTDEGSGMMGGAAQGAAVGTSIMPGWGTAIGAVAGAVMGSASASAARKAKNRQIEAQKLKAIGEIKQREGEQLANVLAGMGSRMKIY
jgi:outer membrane lipoprotein SlyB